jgi:nitrogen fixation/metabolism regulation signal transduction histidine kinase
MANRVAVDLLGLEVGEALEPTLRNRNQLAAVADLVAAAEDHPVQRTLRLEGRGEEELDWSLVWVPLPGGGEPSALLVVEDVSEVLRGQRLQAWAEMARIIAHEIKNPLTPIRLSAERLRHKYLARMPADDSKVLDRATHTIIQQVEAMKTMVNAFSDYARSPQMRPEPLELDRLVVEVTELYRDADGRLRLALETDSVRINGDPLRLRQVIHNLIKNALEAMDGGEESWVRVATRLREEDDRRYVELRVVDNGPGIEEGLLERLFEPYVTSKTKGTGLGLAIVKKIVEEHGGIIWAENCAEGACITLRLPVLPANAGTDDELEST